MLISAGMIECVRFTSSDCTAIFYNLANAKIGPSFMEIYNFVWIYPSSTLGNHQPEKGCPGPMTGCGMLNNTFFSKWYLPAFWVYEKLGDGSLRKKGSAVWQYL